LLAGRAADRRRDREDGHEDAQSRRHWAEI
jgi:hypothetical protein